MAALWLPSDDRHTLALREPNLLVPGKKPVGSVEIDWSHPITNGLRLATLPLAGDARNLVNSAPKLVDYGNVKAGVDLINYGTFAETNGTANGMHTYGAFPVTSWDGVTVIYFGVLQNQTNYPGLISCITPGSFYGNFNLHQNLNQLQLHPGNTSASVVITPLSVTPVVAVASGIYDKITATVRFVNFSTKYRTSASQARTDNFSGDYAITVNGYNRAVGANARVSTRACYAAYVWNRALSEEEVLNIENDPFCFIKPANSTPYLISVPTGGATVTLSSPTATATGTTTATVGCTVTYT